MQFCEKVCNSKRWAFATSICIVMLLAVSGYIVYEKFFNSDDQNSKAGILENFAAIFYSKEQIQNFNHRIFGHPNSKAAILQKYGNILFFTEEQIQNLNLTGNTGRSVANRTERYTKTCSFSCKKSYSHIARDSSAADESNTEIGRGNAKKTGARRENDDVTSGSGEGLHNNAFTTTAASDNDMTTEGNNTLPDLDRVLDGSRTGRERYHGCCVSRTRAVAPETLETADGRTVRVVQFEDRRQIYVEDECQQIQGCTGCTCHKEFRHMSFLVKDNDDDDDERMRVEMLVVPGCCKCMNDEGGR